MAEGKIYAAMCGVMEDIGVVRKNDVNKTQGFPYRGIDAVMNALSPAMNKNKVFCTPEIIEQSREERQSARGNLLIYSICKIRYRFYTTDGSSVEAVTVGEGMDSGDKATNKAMAAAFKYACFQTFCIPTEELMDDPDKESPEAAGRKKQARKTQQKNGAKPTAGSREPANSQEPEGPPAGDGGGSVLLVTEPMLASIRMELERTGKDEKLILDTFKLKKMAEMTVEQYKACMKKFKATPDKEGGAA